MKPSSAQGVLADPAYRCLKDHLIAATGLAYYADKDADLAGRVAQRLARVAAQDCASYLALLADGEQGEVELDALITELTIGETFFFRHREMFDALRTTVFPDLISRNQQSRQLRIWSAGCSTGAEAYTLSIMLKRDLAARLAGWDVTIVGTDINREFLARAREGEFADWAFRATPEEVQRACFTPLGKTWLIRPEYKQGVSFQYHNLVTHPFPSLLNNLFAFDLILCRNVTIYFSLEIVQRILGHFHQCLVDGGWLSVGHSEPNMELFRAYRTVNVPGAVLYQKSQLPTGNAAWLPPPSMAETPPAPAAAGPQPWTPPVLPWVWPGASGTTLDFPPAVPPEKALPPYQATPPLPPIQAVASEVETIRSLADRGEWAKAAQCCDQMLARDKLNPVVYFYQALVLEQLGRHADAEKSLRRSIYLDRNAVLAHYYLGLLLQKQGDLHQAARSFKNVQQLLARIRPDQVFVDGDGITAAELNKLTQMHLEVLEGA